jgi:hypothetical protein
VPLDVYKDWLGISEEIPRPPDQYSLLRLVMFEDDVEKIRGHYKKLNGHVRKYATGTYQVQSQELLNDLAKAMLCLTDPERKRDYDESLGREYEEAEDQVRPTIAQTLVRSGGLSRDQVEEAEDFADRRGLSLRDAVVQMKLVDAEVAAEALAKELGLPYVDLEQLTPDDSILAKIPRGVARRNTILPLFVDDDMLLVACVDEPTHDLEDELRLRTGVPMRRLIASPLSINQGIAKFYAGLEADDESIADAGAAAKKKKEKAKAEVVVAGSSEAKAAEYKLRQIGMILLCWSVVVPVVIDLMVLPSSVKVFQIMDLSLTLIASPILLFLVWNKCYRRR